MWNAKKVSNGFNTETQLVHTLHSSKVLSLYYHNNQSLLFSGGQDFRLVGWDLVVGKPIFPSRRLDGPVRDILPVGNAGQVLLIGFNDRAQTMQLYDLRTNQFTQKLGPTKILETKETMTRYVRASVHPNGYQVAKGSHHISDIDIWDLRYSKLSDTAPQSISIHSRNNLFRWKGVCG